ncbi:hypothetical protein HK405_008284 [Cladochytrium tenue]|nr:hypothetical protein HK405_008284 [Cladochytrium tenue]
MQRIRATATLERKRLNSSTTYAIATDAIIEADNRPSPWWKFVVFLAIIGYHVWHILESTLVIQLESSSFSGVDHDCRTELIRAARLAVGGVGAAAGDLPSVEVDATRVLNYLAPGDASVVVSEFYAPIWIVWLSAAATMLLAVVAAVLNRRSTSRYSSAPVVVAPTSCCELEPQANDSIQLQTTNELYSVRNMTDICSDAGRTSEATDPETASDSTCGSELALLG